jgi:putative copper resistance protein D
MSFQWLSAALVRGLGLVGVASILGGLVLDLLILPVQVEELAVVRMRLRRWITVCLVAVLLTSAAEFLVRMQEMGRPPLGGTMAAVPVVLMHTHFGTIWIVRCVALALAVLLSLARATALRALCLLLTLGIALTVSLTSHAADWGDLAPSVAVDWAHMVAAAAWTGGLIGLIIILCRRGHVWPPDLLGGVGRRFARLAGPCLLIVVLTGTYGAWAQLGAVSRLWTSAYGRVLLVKLLAVVALVGFGAVNRWCFVARLQPDRVGHSFGSRVVRVMRLVLVGRTRLARSELAARFTTYLAWETLIALIVFACTGVLSESTPGRHTPPPQRISKPHLGIKERRQSNDTSSGWNFTPPPGDEGRGRTVFVQLECFTCHTVQGEAVPAPSQPGPDLTDIGSRHPGYVVESIMHPNAMIVDGPGYTDADGRSIMPDYRDKLTVSALIDLVAYLRSLDGTRGPLTPSDTPPTQ